MDVVACPACGQKNRVPRGRRPDGAVCGACKAPLLSAPSAPVAASDATFDALVRSSPVPVLVDFWAPWCGPCRAVAPALDQIAAERVGRLKVVKVNVDQCPQTAARHQIQAIPTLQIWKGGKVADEVKGALSKPALDARLNAALG